MLEFKDFHLPESMIGLGALMISDIITLFLPYFFLKEQNIHE